MDFFFVELTKIFVNMFQRKFFRLNVISNSANFFGFLEKW